MDNPSSVDVARIPQTFQVGLSRNWPDWFLDLVCDNRVVVKQEYNKLFTICYVMTTKSGLQLVNNKDYIMLMPDDELRVIRYAAPYIDRGQLVVNAKSTGEY